MLGRKRKDMIGNKWKVGKSPWNKGMKGYMAGNKNGQWKGDKVGYAALHIWVKRNFGKPTSCEFCDAKVNVQWANKSGDYMRGRSDWMTLCAKCHYHYDRA
jgi:hypothetical protein